MGSEMCIRDSIYVVRFTPAGQLKVDFLHPKEKVPGCKRYALFLHRGHMCTIDATDEFIRWLLGNEHVTGSPQTSPMKGWREVLEESWGQECDFVCDVEARCKHCALSLDIRRKCTALQGRMLPLARGRRAAGPPPLAPTSFFLDCYLSQGDLM